MGRGPQAWKRREARFVSTNNRAPLLIATADTLPAKSQVESCWLQLQSSPTLGSPEVKQSREDLQADDKQTGHLSSTPL